MIALSFQVLLYSKFFNFLFFQIDKVPGAIVESPPLAGTGLQIVIQINLLLILSVLLDYSSL
jgi:hypothetical protein